MKLLLKEIRMKIYRTELDIGLNEKTFIVDPQTIELDNHFSKAECILSSDKISSGYKVYGSINSTTSLKCDRCLIIFENEFQSKISVILTNDKELIKESTSDVVSFLHSDEFTDLSNILRESILIEQPFKKLCKNECKGLCVVCGIDLNNKICSCKKPHLVSGLSDLEDLIN